jgi:hypothetical protein
MALIQCEECKKEISDQSERCIYCGYPIKQENKVQQVEISGVTSYAKKYISLSIIFAILVCGIYFTHTKYKQFEGEKKISISLINISLACFTAFLLQETTYETWQKAIEKGENFNYELIKFSYKNEIKDIKSKISETMKSINAEYAQITTFEKFLSHIYKDYSELYILAGTIAELALNPSGSLQSYGQENRKNSKDFEIAFRKVNSKILFAENSKNFLDWLIAQYR